MQSKLRVNKVDLNIYDYKGMITTISSITLDNYRDMEQFICMVWKKNFYEEDKFDYSLKDEEKGLIIKEDLPKNNDYLISINGITIKEVIKVYLRKKDIKLNIDFETIYDSYILTSNKNYSLESLTYIPYGLNFIFKDKNKIYMIENCIDC